MSTEHIEALKLALEGAANYIDALGGDSRKYRQALAEQPAQQSAERVEPVDWEAVAADQAMTIALVKAELQEFLDKEADAIEVALTESGWMWDGDQWQRPTQKWMGLTDEETKVCFDSVPTQTCQSYEHWRSLVAKALEDKLCQKNT